MLRLARSFPARRLTICCDRRRWAEQVAVEAGEQGTEEYRLFYEQNGARVSPWHSVPLFAGNPDDGICYFVNEIPRGSRAKMEIATKEEDNPIKQDVKKGKLRDYHFDSIVNYGALPQTWEDPSHVDAATQCGGDDDPVDVVEIGSRVAARGEIYKVKVLGVLGMIDEGEMDWKVIAIDVSDPLAPKLNDIDDVHLRLPGRVKAVYEWFRDYKIPDGKPPSEFAWKGEAQDRAFALKVIQETNAHWRAFVEGKTASTLWRPQSL